MLFAAMLVVAAPSVRAAEFESIPAGESHIVFRSEHFSGILPDVYRRDSKHGFEEYASYLKAGGRVQIYYVRIAANRYFPDHSLQSPKESLSDWNYFNEKEITWDVSGKKGTSIGLFRYQKFLVESEKRECVAFTSAWGSSIGEKAGKTKQMQGYFCKPIGQPLSIDEMKQLAKDINFKR